MTQGRGPKSNIGRLGDVRIADIDLRIMKQSYEVLNAPSLIPENTVVGTGKYLSPSPFEATESQDAFDGGYGLRRYTDFRGDPNQAHIMVKEADGVDCRNDSAILSPKIIQETLPGAAGNGVVWFGEIGQHFYAVANMSGRCIYQRQANGTWVQQAFVAQAPPIQGAVGVFNGQLLLGYGAAHTAQWTSDFTTANNVTNDAGTPLNLFVYAYSSDHAAAYIAGGSSSTNQNTVMASSNGTVFQVASITVCGGNDWPIVGLAPGMGLATVMVGKQNELGLIDLGGSTISGGVTLSTAPTYRALIPYDTRWSGNSLGMHWWQSQGGDEQRGQPMLWFPKDREPWLFAPSNVSSGQAQIIAPWAQPDLRPPTVRGVPGAAIATGRWLYYSIQSSTLGKSWLLARDSRSNVSNAFLSLGGTQSTALGITGLFGSNPLLFCCQGVNVGKIILPLDSEFPPDDSNCQYATSGNVDLPAADAGYPLEPKILDSVVVNARGLNPGAQSILIEASYDEGPYIIVGTADTQNTTEILFDPPVDGSGDLRPTVYNVGLRAILSTNDATLTPELNGIGIRMFINPRHFKAWKFNAIIPDGSSLMPSDNLANSLAVLLGLWAIYDHGTPVVFTDLWGVQHLAHVHDMHEINSDREADAEPGTILQITLVEVQGTVPNPSGLSFLLPINGSSIAPVTPKGPFFPYGIGATMMPWIVATSLIQVTGAVLDNTGTNTSYPVLTIQGPGSHLQLRTSLGGNFFLNYEIKAGETVTINMNPTKQIVTNQDGTNLRGLVTGDFFGIPVGGTNLDVTLDFCSYLTLISITWDSFG